MKLFRFAAAALLFAASPATAQWQAPNHATPVGRGAGVTGFGAVGPCLNGAAIIGRGPSADPVCAGAIRTVTAAGPVSIVLEDGIVVINKSSGAPTSVSLPPNPSLNDSHTVKDGKGDAYVNNITVTPNVGTIDGASSFVIRVGHGAATFVYNGTEWNVL